MPNHPKMHRQLPRPRKSARPTWALAGAVGLADWEVSLADSGKVVEAVGLADSGQAAINSADFEIGSADS